MKGYDRKIMRVYVLKISLLLTLVLGLFITSASANGTMSNPKPQDINKMLTEAAIKHKVPPEVVKAVAEVESSWRQFTDKGQPLIASDGGIGIMQITNKKNLDQEKLKYDIKFNIDQGVKILSDNYNRKDLPKIKGANRNVIENWYFSVMAYNGTKPINSPIIQKTGKRNTSAYQEKVFTKIEENIILGRTLVDYPFVVKDFTYDPKSTKNIKFNKLIYTLTTPIASSHSLYKSKTKVITNDSAYFRKGPGTSYEKVNKNKLAKGTILTITGNWKYDTKDKDSINQFVWYPVQTTSGVKGYISSAYLSKYVLTTNTVTNKSTTVTGHAEKGYTLSVKSGSKVLGAIKPKTAAGNYSIKIKAQTAGTKLKVVATDGNGVVHAIKDITVKDVIPPAKPSANAVSDKSTTVSGKAEKGSTVFVKAGKKSDSGKVNSKGQYTVKIPKQKAGTKLTITAKDAAKNVSVARTITVLDKTAPSAPKVNTVTSKTKSVTGKAEANATVTVKVKNKTIGSAKANSKGAFKVTIKAQKKGTTISVTAKDKAKNISKATQVKLKK